MWNRFKRWLERRRRAAFDRRSGIRPAGIWEELDRLGISTESRGWPPVRRVPRYPRPPAPPVDHPAYAEWLKTLPTKKTCYDSDRS